MSQDYYYPKAGGDYRWHITQKCKLAIGRGPNAIMDTSDNKTMLRFDPPLSDADELLVDEIFSDSATACDAPIITVQNNKYVIKDIYEWRAELETNIGFPLTLWFVKDPPESLKPNMIELQFGSKLLTVQDKKAVQDAIDALFIGWV